MLVDVVELDVVEVDVVEVDVVDVVVLVIDVEVELVEDDVTLSDCISHSSLNPPTRTCPGLPQLRKFNSFRPHLGTLKHPIQVSAQ